MTVLDISNRVVNIKFVLRKLRMNRQGSRKQTHPTPLTFLSFDYEGVNSCVECVFARTCTLKLTLCTVGDKRLAN